jgi:hypothetical protein
MGYCVPDIDGVVGDDTLHAVMAFQKANRIGVDGAVGPETRKTLEHAAALEPKETSPQRHVEVDIDRQILMFVWKGEVTHVFDTSTGSGGTFENSSGDTVVAHTPRGHFTVDRRIDGLRVSYLGELWRPAYFDGGYAIHGSPSVPAYPASHGCVRLTMHAMDWAFDRLAVGTPVRVSRRLSPAASSEARRPSGRSGMAVVRTEARTETEVSEGFRGTGTGPVHRPGLTPAPAFGGSPRSASVAGRYGSPGSAR